MKTLKVRVNGSGSLPSFHACDGAVQGAELSMRANLVVVMDAFCTIWKAELRGALRLASMFSVLLWWPLA